MSNRLARADVPVEVTWDLSDLFADDAAWESELQAVAGALSAISAYQGRLGHDAATLHDGLNALESLQLRMARLGTFAHLRLAQDGTDAQHQAAVARVSALHARVDAGTSFVDAEILALPEGRLPDWMAAEPGLADF